MEEGDSKKSNSEASSDSAATAAAAYVVVAINGGDVPLAQFSENDQTHFQRLQEEEMQDSEAEAEEDDKEAGVEVPEEGQRPKLDDGFYEIQAIRRKRVRKGQVQYLVKWQDWPETANTWEPLDNLQSVPDVVNAFEESLRSGKHRKRKRKQAVHYTLPKKRQQRSTTSYSLRNFATREAENHHQSAPINDPSPADLPALPQTVIFADEGEGNGHATGLGKAGLSDEILCTDDPKVRELKANTSSMTSGRAGAKKLAIRFQEAKASTGNGDMDGQSRVDSMKPVQSGRCRGAKRRKSGSVKRFKKDSYACVSDDTQKETTVVEQACTEIANFGGNYSCNMGEAKTACNIVKIIKPLGYTASFTSNIQDISLTFVAMSSDGTEVVVDNKYLKTYNPLLLINFYEQRLRFNPSMCQLN